MKDVANQAGVSVSSVSHVLNRTRFVSDDVKKRVEQAIQTLHFRPNPIARNLRSGKSWLIGFVVSNLENYYYLNIAKGIERVIESQGYRLLLMDSAESKDKEISNVESLFMQGVDGLIIAPTEPDCEYLKKGIIPGYPVVFVSRQPANYSADMVLLDNAAAAKLATKYLISRGYTEIAFLGISFGGNPITKTMEERVSGYEQALEEANIKNNADFIQVLIGKTTAINAMQYTETYKITERLLKLNVRAILCGNSIAAIGAYTCLRDKKIRIPEDVSFITFDDDLWLRLTTPSITSVVQPAESMGAMAAKRLLRRLNEEDLPFECFRLKADIILRES
ncbi:LacI family transcriptional regulator [Treponema sp. OttesenSCG-928-L16]|nr:LacI family transcriptional regulator [Treponema sp. OttesenSCG-928-L16]